MTDAKKTFLEIAALAYSNPKEFERIMQEMNADEFNEYERERFLWLEEQAVARQEKRLH